jgi:NADH-quinone oxidoreductase subunit H
LSGNGLAILQTAFLFGKIFIFIFIFMWVRWTLPRFRYDQLMNLGWKVLLPLAIANVIITGFVMLFLGKLG